MASDLTDLATTNDWEALLTDTERRLVACATHGYFLNLRTGDPEADAVDQADTWDNDRVVRGRVLEVLLLGERNDWPLHHRGLTLAGARITGSVNLAFGTIDAPMGFMDSVFEQPIAMLHAALKTVFMPGTRLPGLMADGVDVTGDVAFRGGFTAVGEVRLLGARIGGSLDCSGGSFTNPGAQALTADGVDVTGDVHLNDGFTAVGEVRLHSARIGNHLECNSGSFTNPGAQALTADGVDVTGDVHLNDGFTAVGEVRLLGARIGGDLSCTGGSITNEGGEALIADKMNVTGVLFLRGATVGGRISVPGASVGLLVDDVDGWHDDWNGDGFTYRDFAGHASVDVDKRIAWLKGGAFRPGPYSHLASVYRRRGDPEAARTVLVARERRRTGELRFWRRPFRWMWGQLSAYGYRPWLAVLWLSALIFVSAIAFANTSMEKLGSDPRVTFYPPLYAADLAIPLVDLRQAGDYQPNEQWAQWWMWGTIALGWFLSGAFLAAVTGIFKPDE